MPHAAMRKRCPVCREVRVFKRPENKACSQRCEAAGRGPAWWKAHHAKLTAARVAKGYSRHLRLMKAAGMTDAQIRVAQKLIASARSSSWAAGRRKGWAEALGERDAA
jgi:hypothetical protein